MIQRNVEKKVSLFWGQKAFLPDAGLVLHSRAGWAICLPEDTGDVEGNVSFPCFLGLAALF